MNGSSFSDVEQELWSGSVVLSIPLDVIDGTFIFTGQVDASSFWNISSELCGFMLFMKLRAVK